MIKRNISRKGIYIFLAVLLVIVTSLSIFFGAVHITVHEIGNALASLFQSGDPLNLNEEIFLKIRLPRAILTVFVGAALAVGGVLMQGLFRNPIVEPGLIGTSSGAAFGTALYFVLGAYIGIDAGRWTLPIAACLGGILATYLVFFLAQGWRGTKMSTVTLLLTGIAINALFLSGVGFLSYIARDPQARSITFWNLGTMSGANFYNTIIVGVSTIVFTLLGLRYAKVLNALMLGEREAGHLGFNVKRLRLIVLLVNVLLVSVATAFVGIIAFVGLVVPHFLRITGYSDNRFLIIGSALAGGALLGIADLTARLALAPAEIPIGIVTSIVGVPVFLYLLRTQTYIFSS